MVPKLWVGTKKWMAGNLNRALKKSRISKILENVCESKKKKKRFWKLVIVTKNYQKDTEKEQNDDKFNKLHLKNKNKKKLP